MTKYKDLKPIVNESDKKRFVETQRQISEVKKCLTKSKDFNSFENNLKKKNLHNTDNILVVSSNVAGVGTVYQKTKDSIREVGVFSKS